MSGESPATTISSNGALTMAPFEEMKAEQPLFDQVAMDEKYLKKDVISDKSVKSAQFAKPYFQFSAACAGCAETTYLKLLSQLFGDHMYAGNAAGCSSAISGGAPILGATKPGSSEPSPSNSMKAEAEVVTAQANSGTIQRCMLMLL